MTFFVKEPGRLRMKLFDLGLIARQDIMINLMALADPLGVRGRQHTAVFAYHHGKLNTLAVSDRLDNALEPGDVIRQNPFLTELCPRPPMLRSDGGNGIFDQLVFTSHVQGSQRIDPDTNEHQNHGDKPANA